MENQIPFIRIPYFASQEECEAIVQQATLYEFGAYHGIVPQINRIGNTVFEYNNISKEMYFRDSIDANRIQKEIFSASFDPINRFINLLNERTGFKISIAARANGEKYFAGLIRRIENGTLIHVDFAPAEQKEWEVGSVLNQLAWNLYLRTSEAEDGKTHIYNRQWVAPDDIYRYNDYGYDAKVVEGAEKVDFQPAIGEVIIFNTRNFHYVDKANNDRITVTSAIGMLPNEEVIIWS